MGVKIKNGAITILVGEDGATIRLHDKDASVAFAEVKLNSQQFCQAMGRLALTECEIEVFGLKKVGKKMEHKKMEFEIGDFDGVTRKGAAQKKALEIIPDGWVSDQYFGSQDSFFWRDDKEWARVTIRRWVDEDSE